jgi:hypothetical protein
VSSRGGVSAAEMYASAKQSPLIVSTALRLAKLPEFRYPDLETKDCGGRRKICGPCLCPLVAGRSQPQPSASFRAVPCRSRSSYRKAHENFRAPPRAVLPSCGHPRARMAWNLFLRASLPLPRQLSELSSVLAARSHGQENPGIGYRAGKTDTPRARRLVRICPISAADSDGRRWAQERLRWPLNTRRVNRISGDAFPDTSFARMWRAQEPPRSIAGMYTRRS